MNVTDTFGSGLPSSVTLPVTCPSRGPPSPQPAKRAMANTKSESDALRYIRIQMLSFSSVAASRGARLRSTSSSELAARPDVADRPITVQHQLSATSLIGNRLAAVLASHGAPHAIRR